MNSRLSNDPTEKTQQERNALRIALYGLIAAIISASFYLYLGLRSGDWQLYAWSADIFALAVSILIGGILIRRGRVSAGVWVIIWAAVITFVGTVMLIEGTGLVIGVGLGILVAVIAGQTLPSGSAARAISIGIAGAATSILLDQYLPPYRLPQPEATRTFLPGIIGAVVLLYGYVIAREFRNYSLRAKFTISVFVITGLSLGAYGYFTYLRASQTQDFLSGKLQFNVRDQSKRKLSDSAVSEARVADNTFVEVTKSLQTLADYRASFYNQSAAFEGSAYWDAESLVQLEGGQYGNSPTDPASITLPNSIPLDDKIITELSLSAYLDFIAPSILQSNPNVVAVYFISESGATTYYPNIGLASLVPPDFDARTGVFYTLATPENNPERKPVWTPPYQDPAGMGLLVTNSIPVYDQRGDFRGVMGADVQLTRVTEQMASIQTNESGFSFLIDSEGRIISMTGAGYAFFGIQPEEVPVNETPKQVILGLGSENLQTVTGNMTQGMDGIAIVSAGEAEYYMAYAPLETVGYSLALAAPADELNASYIEARAIVESEAETTQKLTTLILIGVLLAAAVLSQWTSGALSRSLLQLRETAEQIAQGNLNARARVESKDEIGVLGETFNAMASQLRDLIGSLEQRVTERTRALSTVAEVGTAASTILETDKLLQEVADLTKERFGFYHAHIYMLNEAGDRLVLASGAGEPGRQMVAEGRSIPLDREQSLVARAARERKGVIVNDVTQEPDFLPNPLLPDTRSELAAPMIVGENLVGVFDVQSDLVGRFTDEDANIQTALAAQIAVAVQNARLYAQAEATRQEAKSLVDYAAEGIAILDLETELWAEPNENFAKVFGMTREEMSTTGPKIMSPPAQPDGRNSVEKAVEMINTAMEKGSHRFEWVHLKKDGTPFDCEIGLVRMPGNRPRLRQSILDITERKRLETLTAQRAKQQEALNLITQKIQGAVTIESAMKVAARELGHALGMKPTMISLEPGALAGDGKDRKENAL